MSDINLHQAAEKAHQAEIICVMMESYPHQFTDCEITAISSLLSQLIGNVAAFLIEEQAKQEAITTDKESAHGCFKRV